MKILFPFAIEYNTELKIQIKLNIIFMKKIEIIFVAFLLATTSISGKKELKDDGVKNKSEWNPVGIHGQLQVKGRYLCDEKGDTITLRGVSFGWHNLWPRFYNAKALKWLKDDWKCSIFRAAMGIHLEDNYLENPEFALSCIETVVQAAINEGTYIIIDWHAHDFYMEEAKAFFGSMARKYGKYPNVMYELFNEPTHDHFWPEIKAYSLELIAEIRKYDPDNIILVSTPSWDQHVDIAAKNPITGYNNIMYTFHFYAASHKEEERTRLIKAIDMGLPVFVTESAGCEHTGDGYLDIDEWTKWIKFLEEKQISWVNWSISNKNETCSMILPRGSYEGGWDTGLLKPSGRQSRKFIRFYNTTDKSYENISYNNIVK